MPMQWGSMVLENVPSLKIVMMAAKMASGDKGPSPEERALRQIEDKIMLFWDLMRRHSKDPTGVSYKAYEGLHLRISKSLTNSFSTAEAVGISRQDWKADSVQASERRVRGQERSAIDDVKYRFRAASYKLGSSDWVSLFKQYDKDGNGELDAGEFAVAVRKYVPKDVLSDDELKLLFDDVDEDGGGTIDASEFEAFFFQGTLNQNQFFGSMWELAELWAVEDAGDDDENVFNPVRDAEKFCNFLHEIYDNITVTKVKRADGTVVKVKGGTELRALANNSNDYDLEDLDARATDQAGTTEPELDQLDQPEDGAMFASMEDIEVLQIAAQSDHSESESEEPALGPEPEPEPEPPEPEPEPEPVVYVDPEEIVRFSLDIILRGLDRAIEISCREANLESKGPAFAERKQRQAREGCAKKDMRATIEMSTSSPLYGFRCRRQEVDPAVRPNGRPSLGLHHQGTPQMEKAAAIDGLLHGVSSGAKDEMCPASSQMTDIASSESHLQDVHASNPKTGNGEAAVSGGKAGAMLTPMPPSSARLGKPAAAGATMPPRSHLPTICAGLAVSTRANAIWKRGRGMEGGDGLATGPGSTQVWLPRGDLSTLSPRSSLRNSSSLTLGVAALRKQPQQRLQTPHTTADGYVTSSHWSTWSQASSASGGGVFGGMWSQDSLVSWTTQSSASHSQTSFPSKFVWRANSGSLDAGYGVRTHTLNGSVHTQLSKERMDAVRAHLISADSARRGVHREQSAIVTVHDGRPRDRRGLREQGEPSLDQRPPMRSARAAVHHGARVLHTIPPQEFGLVQHTVRDWKRLDNVSEGMVPHPPTADRQNTAAAASGSSETAAVEPHRQRLGTPPLAKLRESLMSPTASPHPPPQRQLPQSAASSSVRAKERIRGDTVVNGLGSVQCSTLPERMLQPAGW